MGRNELTRMYYLICELRPELPPTQLLNLLPNKITGLFEGAKKHGIGSGDSNSAQLTQVYMDGASIGIDPTESEFRGLICSEIRQALCNKDLKLDQYMKLSAMLADYYGNNASSVSDLETVPFDADVPQVPRFASGLPALDALIGGGVYQCLMTMLGDPGNGKSSLALWIAANWPHGSVSFFEANEMGSALMLNRAGAMGIKFRDPKPLFHFGEYTPDLILEYLNDVPDPNRLVICDSLSAMCGEGDTPESRHKYSRFYAKSIAIKEKCKFLIYTTHLKQNVSGEGINDGGGSSTIGRRSRIIVSVRKEELRPDRTNTMSLYTIKNSMGRAGERQRFQFDLNNNRFIRNLDEETELEDLLDD